MSSERNSTRPLTPLEKYFWMSEEEKKNLKDAPCASTALEVALQNPVKKDPAPAEPRNAIERFFQAPKPELPPRKLTEVEKNFRAPRMLPSKEPTALEKYSNAPRPEPPLRELTDIEKIFHSPKTAPVPRELTATERIFAARRLAEPLAPQPELPLEPAFDSCDVCDVCGGTGRITYPPDARGVVNRAPCNDCQGRGKVPKKD